MKWIILNQIPHLQHYIFHYLKQPNNYKHLNYRNSDDFDFFKADRAILITNNINRLAKRFIEDAKENNIFLTFITENQEIFIEHPNLIFLVREKENFLNLNPKKFNFNISNMHLCMPKILNWIKKKKTGNYNFFNSEIYNSQEDKENNYIQPSEGVEIKEELINLSEKKKINIYMPTYYRFQKTKDSIMDMLEIAKTSIHDVKIYIGDNNTKEKEMHNWLEELNKQEELVEVYFNEENKGKAMIVNYLDNEFARKKYDYFFSIDSDMRIEKEKNKHQDNIFDKMIEILETCQNIGLVAANQSELSQHWYGTTVKMRENRGFKLGYTNNGVGVSGGAICMRQRDWKKLGGYKENHDIYTGDDSILTYNIFRKLAMEAVIAHDYYLKHPKGNEEEKGYTQWKSASWNRDKLNFIKDNYRGSNRKGFFD